MIRILGVCGSLRARSSNLAVLQAAARLAPQDAQIVIHDGLRHLPLFDPDEEATASVAVLAWRQAILQSDALLISSPEYAHGVPGALKNALDWIVGSGELSGKPVAVIESGGQSGHAFTSLLEIVQTMDARIIREASLPLAMPRKTTGADEILSDPNLVRSLQNILAALTSAIGG